MMQTKVKILHMKSVLNWNFYQVEGFSQIQGDYNASDSKIQLILVQYN